MDASSTLFDWRGGELVALDDCAVTETTLEAADSFLVADGAVLDRKSVV